MSDLNTLFAQELIKQVGIALLIVAVIFFIWKLAKPNG